MYEPIVKTKENNRTHLQVLSAVGADDTTCSFQTPWTCPAKKAFQKGEGRTQIRLWPIIAATDRSRLTFSITLCQQLCKPAFTCSYSFYC